MVRFFAALVVLVASCSGAVAQSAVVVQLKPEDAALAKRLYDQKAAIEKQIADLQATIKAQYLKDSCSASKFTFCAVSPTWWYGFEYSTDFKFIVPKLPSNVTIGCPNWSGSTFLSGCCNLNTLTPAYPFSAITADSGHQ